MTPRERHRFEEIHLSRAIKEIFGGAINFYFRRTVAQWSGFRPPEGSRGKPRCTESGGRNPLKLKQFHTTVIERVA